MHGLIDVVCFDSDNHPHPIDNEYQCSFGFRTYPFAHIHEIVFDSKNKEICKKATKLFIEFFAKKIPLYSLKRFKSMGWFESVVSPTPAGCPQIVLKLSKSEYFEFAKKLILLDSSSVKFGKEIHSIC